MDEQTNETQATTETTIESSDNGNPTKTLDKVERAELAVKRIEEGEKRLDEKIKQLQDLQAERLLGGTAGGRVEPKESIDPKEKAKNYAKSVMQGKPQNE